MRDEVGPAETEATAVAAAAPAPAPAPTTATANGFIAAAAPIGKCLVAIGVFDGVHVGHRTIIREMVATGRITGLVPVVMTFEPHPLEVLAPGGGPPRLTTEQGKAALIRGAGVECLVTVPFDRALAALEPERFVREHLFRWCRPLEVYIGFNFTFGAGGRGTAETLKQLGRECGFGVRVFDPVVLDSLTVSSTLIREVVAKGDVALAARLLGRPHLVPGTVVRGDGRGRGLGYPTANVDPLPGLVMPGPGVYAAWVMVGGRPCAAVVNSGRRPTFGGSGPGRLEAHLLCFEGDIYGQAVEIMFIGRLRDEVAFAGPEELRRQIAQDIVAAQAVLGLSGRGQGQGPGAR